MVQGLTTINKLDHSKSYQHIQGCMIQRLNKLSCDIKLTHSEYRLMGVLIGLYNKQHDKAFPTIAQLASYCNMGNTTIINNLNHLVQLGLLVVVKTSGKRNNYYFSNLILTTASNTNIVMQRVTPCSNAHDKQIKNITYKEQTSCHKSNKQPNKHSNDDAFKNTKTALTEYKQVLTQLENWSFTGGKFVIKQYGIDKIKDLIEVVKDNNPINPGGYLRALLNCPDIKPPETNLTSIKSDVKGNDFKPTAQNNNKICEALEHIKAIKQIVEPKPSKEQIIQKLLIEQPQEAEILKKLWKIQN